MYQCNLAIMALQVLLLTTRDLQHPPLQCSKWACHPLATWEQAWCLEVGQILITFLHLLVTLCLHSRYMDLVPSRACLPAMVAPLSIICDVVQNLSDWKCIKLITGSDLICGGLRKMPSILLFRDHFSDRFPLWLDALLSWLKLHWIWVLYMLPSPIKGLSPCIWDHNAWALNNPPSLELSLFLDLNTFNLCLQICWIFEFLSSLSLSLLCG